MITLATWIIIAKLVLAIILGGALGYEREKIGKSAGMRTYALVCIGATLFTIMSVSGFGNSQIASQIVIGIGFLGAGLIMHEKEHITGLTTAAGLWSTAAIGMAIGLGWYTVAVATAIIVFLILVSSKRFTIKSDNGDSIKS